MKKISFIIPVLFLMIANACKKYELPAKSVDPPNCGSITIDSVYKRYTSYYVNHSPLTFYKFPNDLNITCTVTADEVSGNIYRSVFVQDATGTLQIKLINSGGLYVGDLIKINLKGAILDDYGKMVQLDSIDIEKRVVKISSGNIVNPAKVTLNQLLTLNSFSLSNYQSKLVLLDSVEFEVSSKNQLYSDPIFKGSVDRTIINSLGQKVTVRTSGYSKFAGSTTPCGKGRLVAVVSQYNNIIQLILRDVNEVNFTSGNCPYIAKNFEDISITSSGWDTYNVSGNINWTLGNIGGNYANISNYGGGNNSLCETWLISPSFNLSSSTNPVLNFRSACNYIGPVIQTYVSTNYNSGNPTNAIWTLLNPLISPGLWAWTFSGNVNLGAYKSPNVRVAFKYSGTASAGSTWEIDDIGVVEF